MTSVLSDGLACTHVCQLYNLVSASWTQPSIVMWPTINRLQVGFVACPLESTHASASKTSAPWPPYVLMRRPLWGFHRRTDLSLPQVRQYLPLSITGTRKGVIDLLMIKITQLLNLTDLTGPSWPDSSKARCTGRPSTMLETTPKWHYVMQSQSQWVGIFSRARAVVFTGGWLEQTKDDRHNQNTTAKDLQDWTRWHGKCTFFLHLTGYLFYIPTNYSISRQQA